MANIERCGIFCGSNDLRAFVDVQWSENLRSLKQIHGEVEDASGKESPLSDGVWIPGEKKDSVRFEASETGQVYAPGRARVTITVGPEGHEQTDNAYVEAVCDLLGGVGGTIGSGVGAGPGDGIADNIARAANAAESIAASEAAGAAAEQAIAKEGQDALVIGEGLRETGERISRNIGSATGYPFVFTSEDGIDPGGPPSGNALKAVNRAVKTLVGRELPPVSYLRPEKVSETLALMDQNIVLKHRNGVESWEFERSTLISFNAIGAGVTGWQAALASFTNSVRGQIGDLLAGLEPVRALSGNVRRPDAHIALANNSLDAFGAEVGKDGGPDVNKAASCLSQARDHVQALGIELGLANNGNGGFAIDQRNIIVPDDAADSGRYIAVVELVDMLVIAWDRYVSPGIGGSDYGIALRRIDVVLESLDEYAAQARANFATLGFGLDQLRATTFEEGPFARSLDDILTDVEEAPETVRQQLEEGGTIGAGDAEQQIGVLRDQVQLAEEGLPSALADDAPVTRVLGPLSAIDRALGDLQNSLRGFAASFGTAEDDSANGGSTTRRRGRAAAATS